MRQAQRLKMQWLLFPDELIWPATDLKRIGQLKSIGYILIAGRLIPLMDLFAICIRIRKICIAIYLIVNIKICAIFRKSVGSCIPEFTDTHVKSLIFGEGYKPPLLFLLNDAIIFSFIAYLTDLIARSSDYCFGSGRFGCPIEKFCNTKSAAMITRSTLIFFQ
jgi:hypothetical protein